MTAGLSVSFQLSVLSPLIEITEGASNGRSEVLAADEFMLFFEVIGSKR